MLKIQTLASGSKGNVTYVASETTAILVDVGLNPTQLARRMEAAEIEAGAIDAVLITHEHSDHIAGVRPFLKKHNALVYMPAVAAEVFSGYIGEFPEENLRLVSGTFKIGDIDVEYFPVPHDSRFCFGYVFRKGDCKISIATDLGRASAETIAKLSGSQIVLLEANHDLTKLTNNVKYPPHLKRRITGSFGHLSNAASSLAIYELAKSNVQQVILAHLSEENNSPSLAYNFVRDFLLSKGLTEGVDISIDVAKQHEISVVFQVD